jgi:hypothetical protein
MGSRAAPGEAPVIKLSDVKVRVQYRLRVRQRLMVLHFARLQGPTAAGRRFGVSVRTIRRWRVRWRQDALQGLVPRYPRRRGRRITPRVIDLIGQARRDLAYGRSALNCGCAGSTMCAWRWVRSSGSSGISACPACGGPPSGFPDR